MNNTDLTQASAARTGDGGFVGRAASDAMVRLSAEVERDFASLIGKPEMIRLRSLLEQLAEALSD
jgi:hypothetical protein